MVLIRVNIKPHLCEYARSIYVDKDDTYIRFPDSEYLYHVLHNLMSKRPATVSPIDKGNLQIALPHRSRGKDPLVYNYISDNGRKIIERKLNRLFFAHLHDFVDEQVNTFGQPINESVYLFMEHHAIRSISHDALLKSYYRWRTKVRRRISKRKYDRSQ